MRVDRRVDGVRRPRIQTQSRIDVVGVSARTTRRPLACVGGVQPHTLALMPIAPSLLAVTLAMSPYSAPMGAFRVAEPASEAQPGWDEVEAETTPPATDGEVPPPEVTPTDVPPPASPAIPPPPGKPTYNKGTGLIIGAAVTSGLAWAASFTRMAFVSQCQRAVEDASDENGDIDTGVGAATKCFFRAGAANLGLAIMQVPLNWASWGLSPAGGFVRGRYDGVEDAWGKQEARKFGAFIGAGAGLLAVGVVGRITAAALSTAPYKKLADGDVDGFGTSLRLRYFGVQLSAATIAAGAGLLAYGIAYKNNYEGESARVQQVRIAPTYLVDRGSGERITGLAVSGRF